MTVYGSPDLLILLHYIFLYFHLYHPCQPCLVAFPKPLRGDLCALSVQDNKDLELDIIPASLSDREVKLRDANHEVNEEKRKSARKKEYVWGELPPNWQAPRDYAWFSSSPVPFDSFMCPHDHMQEWTYMMLPPLCHTNQERQGISLVETMDHVHLTKHCLITLLFIWALHSYLYP